MLSVTQTIFAILGGVGFIAIVFIAFTRGLHSLGRLPSLLNRKLRDGRSRNISDQGVQ